MNQVQGEVDGEQDRKIQWLESQVKSLLFMTKNKADAQELDEKLEIL